eukprot:5401687-Amphidinium_carterae.2
MKPRSLAHQNKEPNSLEPKEPRWVQYTKGEWMLIDKSPPPLPGMSPQQWVFNEKGDWIEVPPPPPPKTPGPPPPPSSKTQKAALKGMEPEENSDYLEQLGEEDKIPEWALQFKAPPPTRGPI